MMGEEASRRGIGGGRIMKIYMGVSRRRLCIWVFLPFFQRLALFRGIRIGRRQKHA